MRNVCTHIAETAARVWTLADGVRMSVVTRGPNFEREAGLIRTAQV